MKNRNRMFLCKKHLRVLGLTLLETHLTNQSSRLVTETLTRREYWIRNVFKERGRDLSADRTTREDTRLQTYPRDGNSCHGAGFLVRGRKKISKSLMTTEMSLCLCMSIPGCPRLWPEGQTTGSCLCNICMGIFCDKHLEPDGKFVYLVFLGRRR